MRTYALSYDINTQKTYGENGAEIGQNFLPYIRYKEKISISLQYVTDADLTPYTGFSAELIASSAAVDNDFVHYYTGALSGALSGSITEIVVSGLTVDPPQTGNINLINAASDTETVAYTSAVEAGGVWTFTVSATLTYAYASSDEARVQEALLMKTENADIDATDKNTGLFIIPLDANTASFQEAISGVRTLTPQAIFEHKILNASADQIFIAQFDFKCLNILDDDGAVPPAIAGNYYTKTETDALILNKVDADVSGYPESTSPVGSAMLYIYEAATRKFITITNMLNKFLHDTLKLNTAASTPPHEEGIVFWDADNNCPAFYDSVVGTKVQISQEVPMWVYNPSASVTLSDGKVCYLSGIHTDDTPTAALASASNKATCLATLGFATHDIAPLTYGKVVRIGRITDIDTTTGSPSPGDILFLSDTIDGGWTNAEPESPAYSITLGTMGKVNATTGFIEAKIDVGFNKQGTFKLINGSILEEHSTTVTSDGVNITLSLERTGGGDLSLFFDNEFSVYDSTPATTIILTAGTDTVPVKNWVWIPKDTMTLTKSTTGYDTTQQIVPIGTFVCKSAVSTQAYGIFGHHAWTDHLSNTVGQGHLYDINKWIRSQFATWLSGSLISCTGGLNTFDVACTSGTMLQLHEHVSDPFNTATGSDIYVYNDSVSLYKRVSGGLATEVTDSAGVSLAGKYYIMVFWLIGNEGTGNDKLMVNLPSGSYNTLANARTDLNSTASFTMPNNQKGTTMLLAKQIVQNAGGAGGTFTIHDFTDLRGLVPATAGGGASGGGGVSLFTDLADTPAVLVGSELYDVRVNAGGTALEFYDRWVTAPVASTSAGVKGQLAYASNYRYDCVATNTWVRTAVESTF